MRGPHFGGPPRRFGLSSLLDFPTTTQAAPCLSPQDMKRKSDRPNKGTALNPTGVRLSCTASASPDTPARTPIRVAVAGEGIAGPAGKDPKRSSAFLNAGNGMQAAERTGEGKLRQSNQIFRSREIIQHLQRSAAWALDTGLNPRLLFGCPRKMDGSHYGYAALVATAVLTFSLSTLLVILSSRTGDPSVNRRYRHR